MTVLSKCDICRVRKVKCDEQRPSCGACTKKDRKCSYPNPHKSIFLHERQTSEPSYVGRPSASTLEVKLQLRMARDAEGHGKFLTFGSGPRSSQASKGKSIVSCQRHTRGVQSTPSELRRISATTDDTLRARWVFVAQLPQMRVMGDWIDGIPSRIGTDEALDLALEFTLSSMTAFAEPSRINIDGVCLAKAKSIRSLKQTLNGKSLGGIDTNVLFCILLHYFAEASPGIRTMNRGFADLRQMFRDLGSQNYIPHVSGLSRLLASRDRESSSTESAMQMASAICLDEVCEALRLGNDSVLTDHPRRTGPEATSVEVATAAVESMLSRVPQIARLVRAAVHDGPCSKSYPEAYCLAVELYQAESVTLIEQTLLEHTIVRPTGSSLVRPAVMYSLEFDSVNLFVMATNYWTCQVLLCGLLSTLSDLKALPPHVDINGIYTRDMHAANMIAMCADYALRLEGNPPLVSLQLIAPLQISHGAWQRLADRKASPYGPASGHAQRMLKFVFDLGQHLSHVWHFPEEINTRLDQVCSAFAGGDLLWAGRERLLTPVAEHLRRHDGHG